MVVEGVDVRALAKWPLQVLVAVLLLEMVCTSLAVSAQGHRTLLGVHRVAALGCCI